MADLVTLRLDGERPTTEAAALERLRALHLERAGAAPEVIVRAPGRVNLIGEHIDYHGGPVLPAAISLAIYAGASRRTDGRRRVRSADDPLEVETGAGAASAESMTLPRWALYPLGVAEALEARQPFDSGFDLTYVATLPKQKGLSSSAALEVGTAFALSALFGRDSSTGLGTGPSTEPRTGPSTEPRTGPSTEPRASLDRRDLALVVQEAETRASSVKVGPMDPLAILFGRARHAALIDCETLDMRQVPLPVDEFAIVVCDSGRPRSLAAVGYNARREETQDALDELERATGVQFVARAVTADVLNAAAPRLDAKQRRRLAHIATEVERVRRCVAAIEARDMRAVADLFVQSHRSLRFDYEVSTPELDALVSFARDVHPLVAARLTGAGFGGSTVNLVPREVLDRFLDEVPRRYAERFPRGPQCTCLVVDAVDGAALVES